MNRIDRQAIEDLFDRLAKVERDAPQRDSEAEAFIGDKLRTQPAAPYYMAQTIVVQEQALADAEKQIKQLERTSESSRGSVPGIGRPQGLRPETSAGPGFLSGAAQTALGVTGGVLLGNFLASMMSGGKDEAKAQEHKHDAAENESRSDEHDADVDEVGSEDDFFDAGDMDV
jgi:hypothetical protein